jgi:DNA-binding NarL/FixJ family response regulator
MMSAIVESSLTIKAEPQLRTRIVLVEDHAILREGLKALIEIENDLVVIADFCKADDALEQIQSLAPSIVITDLALPGRSGIELLSRIERACPQTRTLVLTANDSEEYIRAALNAGADGYVLKEANRAELMLAIRTVASGRQYLCTEVASKIVSGYLSRGESRSAESKTSTITGREREVLTRIAQGESNKLIARALELSVKTVEKHRSNAMRKLELHNAAGITMFVVRNGLAVGA